LDKGLSLGYNYFAQARFRIMGKSKIKSFPFPCMNCGEDILISLDELTLGRTKKCPVCGKLGLKFSSDFEREIEERIHKTLKRLK